MAHPVADLCRFLEGPWQVRKLGRIGPSGATMRFCGTARFRPSAAGLSFEERGVLTLGAYRGEAARRYEFDLPGDGAAEVRFEDGRPFHRLDLRSGFARVSHDCSPDRYDGRYRVQGPDRWTVGWLIAGPRKADRIVTLFTRPPPKERG